ncbi:MAG: hypothetical protein V4671_27925 [Armatimonadota bacterium]
MAKHIVVLSSDPDLIGRLRAPLELYFYEVDIEAADTDVVDAVARHNPVVVILGHGTARTAPEEWAYERRIMERLEANSGTGRPAVFSITSRHIPPDLMGAYLCDMYLREPFDPKALLAFIRRMTAPVPE